MRPQEQAETATGTVMANACATFEAMLEVLHLQSRQAGPLTGSYVMAAAVAADGRDAIMTAPGAQSLVPVPLPSLPLPAPRAGAAAFADALAMAAGDLADQLAGAAPAAQDPGDGEALRAASLAAGTVRNYLTGTS